MVPSPWQSGGPITLANDNCRTRLIEVTSLGELLSRLDPDPHRRGKQFEYVCKWFLANDPMYRRELYRVWLSDEWEGK